MVNGSRVYERRAGVYGLRAQRVRFGFGGIVLRWVSGFRL